MNWIEKQLTSAAILLLGVAIGLFTVFVGPSLLYVASTAFVLSGMAGLVYHAELDKYVEEIEKQVYTDVYQCDECGDSVKEPEADGPWDCVNCDGRMKRVSKLQELTDNR